MTLFSNPIDRALPFIARKIYPHPRGGERERERERDYKYFVRTHQVSSRTRRALYPVRRGRFISFDWIASRVDSTRVSPVSIIAEKRRDTQYRQLPMWNCNSRWVHDDRQSRKSFFHMTRAFLFSPISANSRRGWRNFRYEDGFYFTGCA